MEHDEKKARLAKTLDYIMSGEYARSERKEEEPELEEDTSYRAKGDVEKSKEVLRGFLGRKVERDEED